VYEQGAKEVAFSVVSGVNGLSSFPLRYYSFSPLVLHI